MIVHRVQTDREAVRVSEVLQQHGAAGQWPFLQSVIGAGARGWWPLVWLWWRAPPPHPGYCYSPQVIDLDTRRMQKTEHKHQLMSVCSSEL